MRIYRFDNYTTINHIDSFVEPEPCVHHTRGVAVGYPAGEWSQQLIGTDCNGLDEPVVLVLTSGHRIQDGRVVDRHITDVRAVYVRPDYTADETADLIMSACDRAGIPVNAESRECLMRNVARDIRKGFSRV